jgi:hypothetical protein
MSKPPEHWPRAVEGIIDSTLDAIGRPALRDIYNAVLGDRITAWRSTNLADVFRKYQEATKDLPPEGKRFVAEKVGIRFLEEASLEDNPDLQKIWANLLAAAVSNQRPEVTPRYIAVAKELTLKEALFLKAVYDRRLKNPLSATIKLKNALQWGGRERIVDIVTHLISLGLVLRHEYSVTLSGGMSISDANVKHLTSLADLDTVVLTNFGWEFICAAVEGAAPIPPAKQQGMEPVRPVGKSRRQRTRPSSRE